MIAESGTIKQRIMVFAMGGILFTALVAVLCTAVPLVRHAVEQRRAAFLSDARLQALAIAHNLDQMVDIAAQVASHDIPRERLEAHGRGATSLRELAAASGTKLRESRGEVPVVAGWSRLNAAGEVVIQLGHPVPFALHPHGPAQVGAPSLLGLVSLQDNGYLLVAAPTLNSEGRRLGTDLLLLRLEGLAADLAAQPDLHDEQVTVILADLQNALKVSLLEGRPLIAPLPEEGLGRLLRRSASGQGVASIEGEGLVAYVPAGEPGWVVALVRPQRSLWLPGWDLLLPFGPLALVVIIGLFATARLIQPLLQRLVADADELVATAREQRALLEYARGFVYRRSSEGAFTYLSKAVEAVTGYRPEALLQGKEALLDESGRRALVAANSADEHSAPALVRILHKQGFPLVLEVKEKPVGKKGEDAVIYGVARDVTASVHAEEALRESEQRLRTVINASPDIICFKDGQGRWLEANDAELALFDLETVAYKGMTDAELAACTDSVVHDAFLGSQRSDEEAWRSGGPTRAEQVVRTVDGVSRTFDIIRVPVFDAQGGRQGLVVLGRDESERKRAEAALAKSAAEWNYAMDFFADAVYLVDLDGKVVRANRAFYQLTGRNPERTLGRHVTELMHPLGEEGPCAVCQTRLAGEDRYITLEAGDSGNPTGRPIEVMVKTIRDDAGVPIGVLMGFHDLTRSRQTEEELRLAASVFEGSQEGIMITDAKHRVIKANQAFFRITGFSPEEVEGLRLRELVSEGNYDTAFCRELWREVEQTGSWQGEVWYRRKDGELFPAWQNLSAVRDPSGKPVRYIGTFTDISEKKASEERIHYLAHHDLLTALPNRVLLHDRLSSALERARRREGLLALLFVDLDRFKNVNDTLGHSVGDQLLEGVAERLTATVRREDTVARLGGDEFVIVLEELDRPQRAGTVARKVLDVLRERIIIGAHEIFIGASIGISLYPADGDTVDTLIKNADAAMYRAKERGRNNFQYYTPELTERSQERFDIETSLRRALAQEELELYYQPRAALDSGAITGVEALIRWNHPVRGVIPADKFIPLAEDSGQIEAIGGWVLRRACAQARRWAGRGTPLPVAVNISAAQIIHGKIVPMVKAVLKESRLDPAMLELEITEGFVLTHAEQGIETLRQLKALGVGLAIDDFGTGYSSLSHLRRLPADRLKIDQSFIRDLSSDADAAAIASTIIAIGGHLNMRVTAEGVETQAQLDHLRRQRCDEYQGYYLSPPVPAEALDEFLENRASA